jgi:hypothetical protein
MKVAKAPGLTRLLGPGGMLLTAGVDDAQETTGIYTNPVSKDFADTFADPSIIKVKDGYWYAYGTSDPLNEGGGTPHTLRIVRRAATSRDGKRWIWDGTWALPAGKTPRIGLISLGKVPPDDDPSTPDDATSRYDYFRVYRP